MHSSSGLCMVWICIVCLVVGFTAPLGAEETIDFDRQIAGIIIHHCLDCHSGPKPKGGLDLSRREAAFKGAESGPGIVPGKPDQSQLWQRVQSNEMPPKKPLPEAEEKVLYTWIASGAKWGTDPIDPFRITTTKRAGFDWWSLQPLQTGKVPTVRDARWARNDIDRFILAKLEARGLSPSPEADRRTLLRRLYFDLIGLPPTPEEVEAFVVDRAPDAYEQRVKQLLDSPHYGERWARHWLDVVRFGETDGFERNSMRPNAWHYRDWVIRALNQDLPYDQFVRLQLAGDLLKPGDPEAMKATGYLVAGLHNTVLPTLATAREMAFQDELEDLVGNVGQTFLGLTVNCARCHEHKFDPLPQSDYYRLASALAGIRHGERDLPVKGDPEAIARLEEERAQIRKGIAAIEEPVRAKLLAERKKDNDLPAGPAPIAAWDFRQSARDQIGNLDVKLHGGARLTTSGLLVNGKTAFAQTAPIERDLKSKTLEVWVHLSNLTQRGGGAMTIETPDGATFDAIVFGEREPRRWMAGSDFFRRTQELKADDETEADRQPVHVAITYAEDGRITAYRNGKPYGSSYQSNGPVLFERGKTVIAFGIRHAPSGGNKMLSGTIVQARLYDRALNADEIGRSAGGAAYVSEAELLAKLTPESRKERERLRQRYAEVEAQVKQLDARQRERAYVALATQPPVTRLLVRGQVSEPSEPIAAGGIGAIRSVKADWNLKPDAPEADRRKQLAFWITHPDNPLFSRVMVNRLWHYHFGTGIVETPNDFGFNGGRPSHPELLDWLATTFRSQGYSLKKMHALIVLSSTYRQAATPRKEAVMIDADTRLLWRKKPLRMDGEVLRDSMLAVAGLLNREIGGKGFSDYRIIDKKNGTTYYDPYDPAGTAFHRRSIYRFLPRGGNPGLLDAFDCPDPSAAAPRRNTTTTPLQALSLWNGPFTLRMAENLAKRVEGLGSTDDERITHVYRLALQRPPSDAERERAGALVKQHGLKALCRAIFNMNEFLSVD